jgi:hypothetical protein
MAIAGAEIWSVRHNPHALPRRSRLAKPLATPASLQLPNAPKEQPAAPKRVGDEAFHLPSAVAAALKKPGLEADRRAALSAAMREWGRIDLAAAAQWAFEEDAPWSDFAIEAALGGAAATRPDLAIELARQLLAADPSVGGPPASALVQSFAAAGRLDLAAQIAAAAPANLAPDLTAAAFAAWARRSPDEALAAAATVSDPNLSRAAWLATVNAWAASDPAGLAQRAWASFTGEDRGFALREAMPHWAQRDDAGLRQWLQTLPPGPDRASGEYVARQYAADGRGAAVF